MSIDDKVEKPNRGNSALNRRNILLGGTTVTAASVITSAGRAAVGSQSHEECVSYYPNESLAQAIVKAWSDKSYEDRLLTFGREQKEANWERFSERERTAIYSKTAGALAEVDVFINTAVVLTVEQYQHSYSPRPGEIVFVLPEVPGKSPTLATARVAMAVQCKGV